MTGESISGEQNANITDKEGETTIRRPTVVKKYLRRVAVDGAFTESEGPYEAPELHITTRRITRI